VSAETTVAVVAVDVLEAVAVLPVPKVTVAAEPALGKNSHSHIT
jgi:hypothetical protein